MRSKNLAGFFAFFLGMFGTHWFYLGRKGAGILQALFFAGSIFMVNVASGNGPELLFGLLITASVLIPVLTAIIWWATPKSEWLARYGKHFGYDVSTQGYLGAPAGANGGFMSDGGSAYGSGADAGALKAEGIRYYRTGDYDLALEAFQEAVSVAPTDAGSHFNLACTHAQLGRYPDALHHLELSVTHGLPGPERIEEHPGLTKLRATPAFTAFRDNNYRVHNHVLELPEANVPPAKNEAPGPTMRPQSTGAERAQSSHRTRAPRPNEQEDIFDESKVELPSLEDPDSPQGDLLEQMSRLRELHDAGVLTPAEYAAQRERLLG